MTALAILRADIGIVIASDGASYDDDGRLRMVKQKVDLHPHISCAIASRGSALAPWFVSDDLFWRGQSPTFDDLVTAMPDLARGARQFVAERGSPTTQNFSLYLCGWSDARERFETYAVRSRDTEQAPACTLIPLPAVYLAPEPYHDVAAAFGMQLPPPDLRAAGWEDLAEYGTRSICAARFCEGSATGENPHCCVGGFVQVTSLARELVLSRIVHRWPDPIGELLDARRGDPSPWHPWPESEARPEGFAGSCGTKGREAQEPACTSTP